MKSSPSALPTLRLALLACLLAATSVAAADDRPDQPVRVRYQITGLFSPDRVADLREAFERLPDIKLIAIDFEEAEATVEYVPAKAFPGAKSDEIVQRFDGKLRPVSNYTFGVKPLRTTPKEKLERVEIEVVGLDCKGCSLAAYEAVSRLEGVERATASFKEGRVTALIDPEKTNRARLEEALTKRGVRLKSR